MQVTCRHCQQPIEFSGTRPARCVHCGQPLADHSDATLDYRPQPGSTATQQEGLVSEAHPETVGDYRLLRPLGQGGMGVVWETEQLGTGRRVALKVLSPRLRPTPENVERFLREGKSAAAISHPRSTFVFQAGQQDGQPYIAMELMPGRTLKDELDESGPFTVERAVDCILDVIDGLEAAHALGVIHRDVKPSNCFLDGDGLVKIGDFGLSKSLVSAADLTQTGAFLGTPQFAAPEQVRGGNIDQRTDVYAVGATLFCLLSGRGPFIGDAAAVIAQIVSEPAPPLSSLRPDVRPSLGRIVARTLEKDPNRRYSDLAALRRSLLPFATGGVSISDVGRRFAAYMLDSLVVGSVTTSIGIGFALFASFRAAAAGVQDQSAYYSPALNALMQATTVCLQVFYFALTEAIWGRGLGKQLMGLRVIGPDGDRPGLVRSCWRSFFVPGALGLVLLPAVAAELGSTNATQVPWSELSMAYVTGPIPIVFTLLCLLTMRARNGYRGVHEFVSGTRVVRPRIALAGRKQRFPVILPLATVGESRRFGPYRVVGEIGRSGTATLFEARDDLLDRAVWIYVDPHGAGVSQDRRSLVRPARPHWLQGGDSLPGRWDAFEAVVGSPLTEIARQNRGAPWHECRFWLLDLAEELHAAVSDGSLPESLSLEQLWIARGGRLKLLDAPVRAAAETAEDTAIHAGPAVERAIVLLREAVELSTRNQVLPMHVREFADELTRRETNEQALAWAVEQLREAVKQPAALGWDQRLGVLAISMGTELSFYLAVAVGIPWAAVALLNWPVQKSALVIPLVLLVPCLVGLAFRGGPAFWLTKIDVLRCDGRRASRWRCAVRGLLAWGPMMIFYATLGLFMGKLMPANSSAGPPPGYQFKPDDPETWLMLGGICGGELLAVLFFIGAIYAIFRPQRGFQDLLAGTWLVPR